MAGQVSNNHLLREGLHLDTKATSNMWDDHPQLVSRLIKTLTQGITQEVRNLVGRPDHQFTRLLTEFGQHPAIFHGNARDTRVVEGAAHLYLSLLKFCCSMIGPVLRVEQDVISQLLMDLE